MTKWGVSVLILVSACGMPDHLSGGVSLSQSEPVLQEQFDATMQCLARWDLDVEPKDLHVAIVPVVPCPTARLCCLEGREDATGLFRSWAEVPTIIIPQHCVEDDPHGCGCAYAHELIHFALWAKGLPHSDHEGPWWACQ